MALMPGPASCPHCTPLKLKVSSCCACGGTRKIHNPKALQRAMLQAWSRPGCHCEACEILRAQELRLTLHKKPSGKK